MAIASKLTAIGIITLSLAIGFLFFYIYSDLKKGQKKKHIEELTSQLINFVIFIWLGKIVLNLSTFLSDPLSVLAYPSDSKAFYFAIVLIALLLLYKSKRKNMKVLPLLESFVQLFLISSFVYEFIQLVVEDNSYAFGYVILLAILIGIFFFLRERLNVIILLIILVTAWSVGMVSLALIQPFVTVFGYMMAPWFVGVIFITSIGGLTYKLRKRDA
ncbi:hypothetical protein [Ornithinibacillus californiensis]|uniref:hypothetical protein n=1 Tax=Ornithinibacillus californiensis TaxID=161536 RepID=UPI00064DD5D8|nr:hypothetical protein [Ornithinibacillus californiensis]